MMNTKQSPTEQTLLRIFSAMIIVAFVITIAAIWQREYHKRLEFKQCMAEIEAQTSVAVPACVEAK